MIKRFLELPDDNPVFEHDMQNIRWIRTPDHITRYTWVSVLVVSVGALVLVGLVLAFGLFSAALAEDPTGALQIGLFSVGSYIAQDLLNTGYIPALGAVFFAIGLINSDKTTNRLDLVRLAAGEEAIVNGRHAVAMIRAWRLTAVWVAGRLVGALLVIFAGVLFLTQNDIAEFFRAELGVSFQDAWLWFAVPILLLMGMAYLVYSLLEPIWEMRALTALGINISTRTQERVGAIALGFVGWIVMNTLLSLVYLVFFLPVFAAYSFLFIASPENIERWLPYILVVGLVGVPIYVGIGAVIVYLFYRTARRRLLKNAVTRITDEA